MHGLIFQLSKTKLSKDDFVSEENINSSRIDYVEQLNSVEDRNACISQLIYLTLPEGMFTMSDDGTITYNGGIERYFEQYVARVQEKLTRLQNTKRFAWREVYQLRQAVNNDLDSDTLFMLGADVAACESEPDKPIEFFLMVQETMKPGDKLYIGSIFDYHF